MRFMVMTIAEGQGSAEVDSAPSAEATAKMRAYNKSLQNAGVLLALEGLFPPSTAARISCIDGKPTATEGPFVQQKDVIGGYWIIEVRSREEAIEWAKRALVSNDSVIEVRQVREMSDLRAGAQRAAEGFEPLTR